MLMAADSEAGHRELQPKPQLCTESLTKDILRSANPIDARLPAYRLRSTHAISGRPTGQSEPHHLFGDAPGWRLFY